MNGATPFPKAINRGGAALPRAGLLLEAGFLAGALALLLAAAEKQSIRSLSLIFTSIILEALPFMLFGAAVGGLVEIFLSRERMTGLLPKKHPWLAMFIAAAMGLLFPVCECAVVPVVRRLARKGLPAGAAIAYLLGGPIVNPIVATSTALAYKFDLQIVLLRLGWGYVIAVTAGLVMNSLFDKNRALRADLLPEEVSSCVCVIGSASGTTTPASDGREIPGAPPVCPVSRFVPGFP